MYNEGKNTLETILITNQNYNSVAYFLNILLKSRICTISYLLTTSKYIVNDFILYFF